MLAFAGIQSEAPILEAAARAGVKYVFPSDYGADLSIKGTSFAIKLIEMKKKTYEHVQQLGMKWIVVVTNPWVDYVRACPDVLSTVGTIDCQLVLGTRSLWNLRS